MGAATPEKKWERQKDGCDRRKRLHLKENNNNILNVEDESISYSYNSEIDRLHEHIVNRLTMSETQYQSSTRSFQTLEDQSSWLWMYIFDRYPRLTMSTWSTLPSSRSEKNGRMPGWHSTDSLMIIRKWVKNFCCLTISVYSVRYMNSWGTEVGCLDARLIAGSWYNSVITTRSSQVPPFLVLATSEHSDLSQQIWMPDTFFQNEKWVHWRLLASLRICAYNEQGSSALASKLARNFLVYLRKAVVQFHVSLEYSRLLRTLWIAELGGNSKPTGLIMEM